MNKKRSIEDKFSIDMDAYFNGIEEIDKTSDGDYNELLELGKTLANKDFSKASNKEVVYNKTLKNIEEHREYNDMKKSNKFRKVAVSAASLAIVCVVFSQTSFAKNLVEKVINLGHITVFQMELSKAKEIAIPDNLKGKIFDKNGKPITVFSRDTGKIYTASGEQIESFIGGKIITVAERKKMMEYALTVRDSTSLNKYTCFNVILPSYLPENYKFEKAGFFKDKKGNIANKYIDLYFTNEKTGKYIYMQQRFADKETSYQMASDEKVEKIKVNGVEAVITGNRIIDWEVNGVLYNLSGRGEITKAELVKIAESIK